MSESSSEEFVEEFDNDIPMWNISSYSEDVDSTEESDSSSNSYVDELEELYSSDHNKLLNDSRKLRAVTISSSPEYNLLLLKQAIKQELIEACQILIKSNVNDDKAILVACDLIG